MRDRLPGAYEPAEFSNATRAKQDEASVNSTSTIEKSSERLKRSVTTLGPGAPGKIRRTRGANPANRRGTPKMKSNGHDTGVSRVNGHGPASPADPAQEMEAPLEKGWAASDDTRDFPAAADASSASAGKERDVCAEVAPPSAGRAKAGKEKKKQAGSGAPPVPSESGGQVDIPPGSEPLPMDGPGFVDAMHAHVDLYLACARLVKSKDEKIAQRMVERLLEMSYGKSPAAAGEEAPQIILDAPRPIRD